MHLSMSSPWGVGGRATLGDFDIFMETDQNPYPGAITNSQNPHRRTLGTSHNSLRYTTQLLAI